MIILLLLDNVDNRTDIVHTIISHTRHYLYSIYYNCTPYVLIQQLGFAVNQPPTISSTWPIHTPEQISGLFPWVEEQQFIPSIDWMNHTDHPPTLLRITMGCLVAFPPPSLPTIQTNTHDSSIFWLVAVRWTLLTSVCDPHSCHGDQSDQYPINLWWVHVKSKKFENSDLPLIGRGEQKRDLFCVFIGRDDVY